MPWPLSQDYNEAVQNPAQCFTDPELKQGDAVTNEMGLPRPCSGNFADVYAVVSGQRKWAVKCFTRQIPGLRERYAEISKYLAQVQLPFMVDFKFLEQGIRVRGQWYPVLKMQWVEGVPLNTFVRDNLDKPQILQMLCQIWARLATRLREANLAHADLQHGNVLLVPGAKATTLGVRLVDYDGMCVPALELLRSAEVGHPSYQHPQRLREGTYGLQIDRFSYLVIYTALRSLVIGGRALWEKFDNGDNLLFTQRDFEAPRQAAVFQELLKLDDPEVRKVVQALAVASQKPIDQVPLLEQLVPAQKPPAGVSPSSTSAEAIKGNPHTGMGPAISQPVGASGEDTFAAATADSTSIRQTRYQARRNRNPVIAIAVSLAVLVPLVVGAALHFGSRSGRPPAEAQFVQTPSESDYEDTKAPTKSQTQQAVAALASTLAGNTPQVDQPTRSGTKSGPVARPPAPSGNRLVLRGRGMVRDSLIDFSRPDRKHGTESRDNQVCRGSSECGAFLVRFDLAQAPLAPEKLEKATLSFFVWDPHSHAVAKVCAFGVLTPWDEATVTWKQAGEGKPWKGGKNFAFGTDTGPASPHVVVLQDMGSDTVDPPLEYQLDVTPLARSWLAGSQPNHGVAIAPVIDRAIDQGSQSRFRLYSSRHNRVQYTPTLTLQLQP